MDKLLTKMTSTNERYSMLRQDVPLVVMISGGGDSVALLHVLASGHLGELPNIHALHVNHLLRGAESEGDETYVRTFCESLGVPLTVKRIDVGSFAAEHGLNLEDAGRIVRYEAAEELLDDLCADIDVHTSLGRIATAHSRDDRVETFFSRALSGSGTGALGSIAAVRGRIIRPLIDCDRAEIRALLLEEGIEWREDISNQDTERNRAYIRTHIVPACENLNPSFRESLTRTMDLLADDDKLLTSMADMFARDFVDDIEPGEYITFNVSFMRTLDRTMMRRTLRQALMQTFPEASRMEAFHIEALADGLESESFVRDLPEGLRAELRCGTLRISKKRESEVCLNSVLEVGGLTGLGPAGSILVSEVDPGSISTDPMVATVDAGLMLGSLSAGPVREGDRIVPLGMTGSKKVSDIFVDAKVAREFRALVPIVRDGTKPIWVAGQCVSDEYRITHETKRALRIEWLS